MHTWASVIVREGLRTALTALGAPECLWGEEGHCAREAQVGHWEEFLRRKGCQSSGRGFGVLPVAAGSRVCGKYQRVLSGRVGGNLAGEVKILH